MKKILVRIVVVIAAVIAVTVKNPKKKKKIKREKKGHKIKVRMTRKRINNNKKLIVGQAMMNPNPSKFYIISFSKKKITIIIIIYESNKNLK